MRWCGRCQRPAIVPWQSLQSFQRTAIREYQASPSGMAPHTTRIAIAYEKAAAIEDLPASEREHFANQASRFRWLAKHAAQKAAEKAAPGEARKAQYDLARRWAAWRLQTD